MKRARRGARPGRRTRYGNISQEGRNESARRVQKAMVLGVIFNGCGYYAMQYMRMGRILTPEDWGRRDAWDLLRGFDDKREVLSHGSESGASVLLPEGQYSLLRSSLAEELG